MEDQEPSANKDSQFSLNVPAGSENEDESSKGDVVSQIKRRTTTFVQGIGSSGSGGTGISDIKKAKSQATGLGIPEGGDDSRESIVDRDSGNDSQLKRRVTRFMSGLGIPGGGDNGKESDSNAGVSSALGPLTPTLEMEEEEEEDDESSEDDIKSL